MEMFHVEQSKKEATGSLCVRSSRLEAQAFEEE
jgi:hypothetical protein